MKKERKKIPFKIKVITVLIVLLIAVLAFLKAEGLIFSKVSYDKNDETNHTLLYKGNKYHKIELENYSLIGAVQIANLGIIVEPVRYYVSEYDKNEDVITKRHIWGDGVFLKEGVVFDTNTIPTGMILLYGDKPYTLAKYDKSKYIQDKNIMNKIQHIINYSELYPSEHIEVARVNYRLCYNNLPLGVKEESTYWIRLCEDGCWVAQHYNSGRMYKIIDEEVIEFLNDFISEED